MGRRVNRFSVAQITLVAVTRERFSIQNRVIKRGHPHDVSPQLWEDVRWICAEMEEKKRP